MTLGRTAAPANTVDSGAVTSATAGDGSTDGAGVSGGTGGKERTAGGSASSGGGVPLVEDRGGSTAGSAVNDGVASEVT
jgi:hypothetical protein